MAALRLDYLGESRAFIFVVSCRPCSARNESNISLLYLRGLGRSSWGRGADVRIICLSTLNPTHPLPPPPILLCLWAYFIPFCPPVLTFLDCDSDFLLIFFREGKGFLRHAIPISITRRWLALSQVVLMLIKNQLSCAS